MKTLIRDLKLALWLYFAAFSIAFAISQLSGLWQAVATAAARYEGGVERLAAYQQESP